MLTAEESERLTAVGPGTVMGQLMRRYWHPIAATAQLEEEPVKAVTLLGEDLVLFRDGGSRLGLLAEHCLHRRTSLVYGIPEKDGIRCAYHGWTYDRTGQCIEQPTEPEGSTFASRMKTQAYRVEELGGLIFAYMGPEPAPLLPRYNVLVWNHALRETNGTVINCNWLQVIENMLDPAHVAALHGRYFSYILDKTDPEEAARFRARFMPGPMKKIGFDLFEQGITERHMNSSESEYSWTHGSSVFFPNVALMGSPNKSGSIIYVVPIDDTHTWFLLHMARPSDKAPNFGGPAPFYDVAGIDENGKYMLGTANGQDNMAVATQGAVTPRDLEHLGTSDLGIIMFRDMLLQQAAVLEDGGEPMNILRDPAANRRIDLPDASLVGESERHEVLMHA
jgi:5,5'-dehydrodivanillate O-demethylase